MLDATSATTKTVIGSRSSDGKMPFIEIVLPLTVWAAILTGRWVSLYVDSHSRLRPVEITVNEDDVRQMHPSDVLKDPVALPSGPPVDDVNGMAADASIRAASADDTAQAEAEAEAPTRRSSEMGPLRPIGVSIATSASSEIC